MKYDRKKETASKWQRVVAKVRRQLYLACVFLWPQNHRQLTDIDLQKTLSNEMKKKKTMRFWVERGSVNVYAATKMSNNWIMLCLTISFAFMSCIRSICATFSRSLSRSSFLFFCSCFYHSCWSGFCLMISESESLKRGEMKTKSPLNWYQRESNKHKKMANVDIVNENVISESQQTAGKTPKKEQQISRHADCHRVRHNHSTYTRTVQ